LLDILLEYDIKVGLKDLV